jgi:DNA-binding winged helix-turn-helix (wHTH) protein
MPASFKFGEFEVDVRTRELMRRGTLIHLTPKAYELLALLLERQPEAVSKALIHERVWSGAFISDTTMATVVYELRQALGESAREPRFLHTRHGFGFQFVSTPAPAAGPHHKLIADHAAFELTAGEHFIGRSRRCAIPLDSPKVSRRHARLLVHEAGVTIEDCGSSNGTYVAGAKLDGPRVLDDGEEIQIGDRTLRFRSMTAMESGAATET